MTDANGTSKEVRERNIEYASLVQKAQDGNF